MSVRVGADGVPMLVLTSLKSGESRSLLYVQRSGWVMWAPDSARFVFSDAAFSNHYFIRVCSAAPSATRCQDFSQVLESRLRESLSSDSKLDKIYLKALSWDSPSELLVGAHFVSFREAETRGNYTAVHWHFRAYVLDIVTGRVLLVLDEAAARRRIGRPLDSLQW